jgi:hypothetical protein
MALFRLEDGEGKIDGRVTTWAAQRQHDLMLSVQMRAAGELTLPLVEAWRVALPGQGKIKLATPEGDVDASYYIKLATAADWDRLFGIQCAAPRVRTAAEAEAYLKDRHDEMGDGGSANETAQARVGGIMEGFVLCGLMTRREAKVWAGRFLECPNDGLHGGGQSWCPYCDNVCTRCGEPQRVGSHPTRLCACPPED